MDYFVRVKMLEREADDFSSSITTVKKALRFISDPLAQFSMRNTY
jgi:hypothetical protein